MAMKFGLGAEIQSPTGLCVVCLQSLRSVEGNDAQICFFIVQMLLLRNKEFTMRVQEFVREV